MSGLHIAATTGNVLGPEAVDVTWCQDCRRNCASADPCSCCAAVAPPLTDEPTEETATDE